jgi:Uma2 family endonuclease
MSTVVIEDRILIPCWVEDLESFRRWVDTDEFPEDGRICYLDGEVWVDMSKEQAFTHNQVKTEYAAVLSGLAEQSSRGHYFAAGLYVSNVAANLSVKPDGSFVSRRSLRLVRIRLVEDGQGGFNELEGTPDMTLEVLSDSSVQKDTVRLRELYWRAGISEYWLVDARTSPVSFEILRRTAKGYVRVAKQAGWQKSVVFGKSFKLSVRSDEDGLPEYTLAVR